MKIQFLKKLNHELKCLTKEEREKNLNDYKEIILDKMENGMTEEDAVYSLGNVEQIGRDIINSYLEIDEEKDNDHKYTKMIYPFIDTTIISGSYVLAYYLCFKSGFLGREISHLAFEKYMIGLLFIIPCYLALYYIFRAYTTKYVYWKRWAIKNILWSNLVGIAIFLLILYLFHITLFSRIMIVSFLFINILLEVTIRNFIFNLFISIYQKIKFLKIS